MNSSLAVTFEAYRAGRKRTTMRSGIDEEIREAVARCIATGQLLWLSDQARRIAAKTNADERTTKGALLSAAVAARVNVRFG